METHPGARENTEKSVHQRGDGLAEKAFGEPARRLLDCIGAFGRTDFRDDLARFDVPTLVIHGDSDAIVPFEVSGARSHETIPGSELVLIEGAPHGSNATHAGQFNRALIDFLAR